MSDVDRTSQRDNRAVAPGHGADLGASGPCICSISHIRSEQVQRSPDKARPHETLLAERSDELRASLFAYQSACDALSAAEELDPGRHDVGHELLQVRISRQRCLTDLDGLISMPASTMAGACCKRQAFRAYLETFAEMDATSARLAISTFDDLDRLEAERSPSRPPLGSTHPLP